MRSLKLLLVVVSIGSVVTVPALAQQPSTYPVACDASKVSKGDVERAHQVFLSGKEYLEESNYDKAIGYFKDAYSIDCSVHAILGIIATAYERKGDKAQAVVALEEYVKRAPNAPDHEIVERRIANLKAQIAAAQPAPSAAPIPPADAPPPSAPVETPPAASPPASSAAPSPPPGDQATGLQADSDQTASASGGSGVAPWVVVGLGGAAIATGVVLLKLGDDQISSAVSACPSRNCGNDHTDADLGNQGRLFEGIGWAAGGVGVAGVVAGLIWHFTQGAPTPSSTSMRPTLSPVVAPGYAGIGMGGRF